MSDDRYVASRRIAAPVADVFDLIATPAHHHRFDASAMVGEQVGSTRPAAAGDVFVMEMTYRDGDQVEHYRTDNHVTEFDEQRCLEWAVAPAGEELLGWRWRYELEPIADDATRVTLTYDWSDTPADNRRRFGVPLFDEAHLAASLDLLAAAAERSRRDGASD